MERGDGQRALHFSSQILEAQFRLTVNISRFISFSYLLSSVRIFDCPRSLCGGERVPLLMLSLIVEAQCLTGSMKLNLAKILSSLLI